MRAIPPVREGGGGGGREPGMLIGAYLGWLRFVCQLWNVSQYKYACKDDADTEYSIFFIAYFIVIVY